MSALAAVGDKLPETIIGPFDAQALARYAEVSGDANPLHLDDALAAGIGFAAPPVHGMKMLAAFEPMLNNWRNDLDIVSLSGKFVQPILRGEKITLSGRVLRASDTEIFVRLFAHGTERLPGVIGEATLRPRAARAMA
jgi:acyl dehydratase